MILLGITGAIGHGKSTLAERLQKLEANAQHYESSALISEVANAQRQQTTVVPKPNNLQSINDWLDPLPNVLAHVVSTKCQLKDLLIKQADVLHKPELYEKLFAYLTLSATKPSLLHETITHENKNNHRALLQWFGAYLPARTVPNLWYKELVKRAKSDKLCQLAIFGGLRFPADAQVIHDAGGIVLEIIRPGLEESDTNDPTERERSQIKSDAVVYNDNNIAHLEKAAQKLLQDLKNNNLQPVYFASKF